MSYSQTFSDSVTVSGSKSVSYPKSESGGSMTVSFRETVPINVTIHVRTEAFDDSVSRCNSTVDVLTGAVTVMNAAQVAAIREKTGNIAQSLVDGFYGTINSEISQQMQSLYSNITAKTALILEQGKAVSDQKNTMETDYRRIASRYSNVFSNLDDECYKRVIALDRKAFDLAEHAEKKILSGLSGQASAGNYITAGEGASSSMIMLASTLFRRVREVIENLDQYINQEQVFSDTMAASLRDEPVKEAGNISVPVIFSETENMEADKGETIRACFHPPYPNPQNKNEIDKAVTDFCGRADWDTFSPEEQAILNQEFNRLAENEFNSEDAGENRVYETMMNLWRSSAHHTLRKG